jgi:hypothetical protein
LRLMLLKLSGVVPEEAGTPVCDMPFVSALPGATP